MLVSSMDRTRLVRGLLIVVGILALVMAAEAELLAQCEDCSEPLSCEQCGKLVDSPLDGCGKQGLCEREYLFGDWAGARPCLAQHGIVADLQLTQFYQGVSSGGAAQNFAYGGKLDYQFTFLGEPLGLNKGFTTLLHAETRFGQDSNAAAGALAFPNTNMLYPFPGENQTAITGLLMMQALNERFALAAGKINFLDLWAMLYPDSGRGVDGFMNISLIAFPTFFRTTNLSILGAGALTMKDKQIQGGVFVYDTHNSSTTSGFDNLFDEGAVVLGLWRFFTNHGGLPGSHAFIGNWSSRTYTSLDRLNWTVLPGQGLQPGEETGSWGLAYVWDQKLWVDRCNKNRTLGFMTQLTLADGNPNFYRWSANAALQAQGLIHCREFDTMGVGYFYDALSSDFKQLVAPVIALEDVHGCELYYNVQITPWFHLTADIQVIQNEIVADDPAIVFGLRANAKL